MDRSGVSPDLRPPTPAQTLLTGGVSPFTYANQLALLATRQIKPAYDHISRIARRFIRRARALSRTAASAALSSHVIAFATIVNVTWIPHGSLLQP